MPKASIALRRTYAIDPITDLAVDTQGRITGFTMSVTEKLFVDKLVNCALTVKNWTQLRFVAHISR
ncbi:MAG: hypothetical protein U0Q21_05090 [Dermatophilaceae bacterium]